MPTVSLASEIIDYPHHMKSTSPAHRPGDCPAIKLYYIVKSPQCQLLQNRYLDTGSMCCNLAQLTQPTRAFPRTHLFLLCMCYVLTGTHGSTGPRGICGFNVFSGSMVQWFNGSDEVSTTK